MKNNNKYIKFIYILLIILTLISSIYLIKFYIDTLNAKKQKSLLNESQISATKISTSKADNTASEKSVIEDTAENSEPTNIKSEKILKLENLQNINSEIIGWLEIENTDINFPVLQTDNNDYYMKHNYKKEYSTNGSIFLDKDFDWNRPSDNLLIYGHNMNNNTMFQSLLNYKDKNYYEQHPIIKFTTNNEDANYEIISVFKSRVYYKNEKNVFRYYYFINAKNENEYNEFVYNCKKASLYDTNKIAKYGDQLLTLSTCSYHTKDGRFVVVAKKI